jgi:hypothetical protein
MDSGTASLIGVLVGAGITSMREVMTYYFQRGKSRVYLASRVAPSLEAFIAQCARVAIDEGDDNNAQGFSYPSTDTPSIDFKGLDVDWKTLPPALMRELLEIPSRIDIANAVIGDENEYSTPPDYEEFFMVRRTEFGKLGLHVQNLLTQLLEHARLPARSVRSWNPVFEINRELADVEKRRAERYSVHFELSETAPAAPLPGGTGSDA